MGGYRHTLLNYLDTLGVRSPMQEQPETQHENEQSAEGHEESLYAALRQAEEKQNSRYQKARTYFSEWRNVVATLTLLFVGSYTVLTYFLLSSSHEQARISRDTEQRQLRAYISAAVERYPDITAEHLELTMVMKNHGQTPAFDMRGWSIMVISEFSPLPEGIVREGEAEMENQGDKTVLFPGEERRGATLDGVGSVGKSRDPTEAERLGIQLGFKSLWVFGKITYQDAFGVDRFTRFRLFQTGQYMVRMKKLFWADQGNCTDETCSKDVAQ
jgi:hypothetical protein